MSPETQALLRAVAELASYAQGHPTDSKGIALRTQARNRASVAWTQAGSPDLEGAPRPAVIAPGTGRVDDAEKDWTPVEVLVEVKRVTEKAYLLDAGEALGPSGTFWCPKAVIREADPTFPDVGDVATMSVPRWVLP